jgi:hypothetical protein
MLNLAAVLGACAGFVLFVLYSSLFEYAYHRWLLHRHWRVLPHPYRIHVLIHHRTFGGDATYHVRHGEDRDSILFQWWQVLVLLGGNAPVVWGVQLATGIPVFWGGMIALAAYYGVYEHAHWCMHNPAGWWIERTRLFRFLSANHRDHHRLWQINFNVVLPLGDLVFGTFRPAPALSRSS